MHSFVNNIKTNCKYSFRWKATTKVNWQIIRCVFCIIFCFVWLLRANVHCLVFIILLFFFLCVNVIAMAEEIHIEEPQISSTWQTFNNKYSSQELLQKLNVSPAGTTNFLFCINLIEKFFYWFNLCVVCCYVVQVWHTRAYLPSSKWCNNNKKRTRNSSGCVIKKAKKEPALYVY